MIFNGLNKLRFYPYKNIKDIKFVTEELKKIRIGLVKSFADIRNRHEKESKN